jgi:GTP cyclohydrolase I
MTNFVENLGKRKFDPELGTKVHDKLVSAGCEQPYDSNLHYHPAHAHDELMQAIAKVIPHLGLDLNDESLQDTPKRFADMFVGELTNGLDYNRFPKCTTTPAHDDQMVIVRGVQVMSLCEHHLQTIDGIANIAYIPRHRLLGLSKFARITEFFSRRPQVQERLTSQIAKTLQFILDTEHVAVSITATHYCMRARGAMQHASVTTTNVMSGHFLNKQAAREEFFHGCQ